MPFGEIVCGSPGSGKSTYCYGKHQLFTALSRPISIVNLDPANDNIPYPCAIDISSLITLRDVMNEYQLGPNGGMLYCMEYLEANYDWLEDRLKELGKDAYVLFDLPGQVELSTNHESVKRIIEWLTKGGFRLAAIHLCDAHYITDASKYVSVLLLSLRAMLHLELPHVNVLSKIDLISQYGDLGESCCEPGLLAYASEDFNLSFYTEVQDLSYLSNALEASSPRRYAALNMALVSLIEDYNLVGFETLAVEDKTSMTHLSRTIDRVTGYVFVPPVDSPMPPDVVPDQHGLPSSTRPNTYALFSSAINSAGGYDVKDVQERWIDAKEEWDEWERAMWKKEGEAARATNPATGTKLRTRAQAREASSKIKVENIDESSSELEDTDDIECHVNALKRSLEKYRRKLKKLVRMNQDLQGQVERLQSCVNGQPKKPRGRFTGLDSQIKQLEEKHARKGRRKDKQKISALRAREAKAEAKDLLNDSDSGSRSGDSPHKMRKLLRRHNDIMLVTPLPTDAEGKAEDCPICMEVFVANKCSRRVDSCLDVLLLLSAEFSLPCEHVICNACLPGISKGVDETLQCPQCRRVCPRDDVEIVYMTETERWDRLLEVAQAWGAMDKCGEEETSEEEAQEDFINDRTSSVSSPLNDANTTEEEDDMISKNGEHSDEGANPSSYAQSPLKVKRERLAHLAEERRKKRRLS
ncbi:uncharacterized protein BT62DRAFT_1002624 [Guyanagaster necrorhizus]|uniref:ATP-binding domain 1 family member B homolog n=1 Tax=Guyanagaster necrorhizus TaxID=856835 RepID=A0A9P8AV95_9AGAR|nr:uncharacterized protein BT62DRAFT_1002624 [Guyanagaster necrorhizus MCA 3950]KAG7449075.1 hypothetical protein BT62DRAFT_1002624 [Guyanagaster necrorhizus MCA 3950]